jgi:hypothetical protein
MPFDDLSYRWEPPEEPEPVGCRYCDAFALVCAIVLVFLLGALLVWLWSRHF